MATADDGLSTFLSVRARLVRTTSRLLGSSAAAEDVVQDAWIRWQSTNRDEVRDAEAFLRTTAIRLAINVRQSAHSRRETWAEQWLSEPIDAGPEQIVHAERSDALTVGVLVLLERLSSAERVAYVLREACDYSYRDIASVLDVQEANARQRARRARMRLAEAPTMRAPSERHARAARMSEDTRRELLTALSAAQAGNPRALLELFAAKTRENARKRNVGSRQPSPFLHRPRELANVRPEVPGGAR